MATFSVLRSLALNSSKQGALNFSTSTCLCKRQSPRTVGVMGWFKAARRRLDHERKMKEKPKTPVQLEAEVRLQQQEGIEFLTTNRMKYRMSEDGNKLAIKPEVMLSKDRQSFATIHHQSSFLSISLLQQRLVHVGKASLLMIMKRHSQRSRSLR